MAQFCVNCGADISGDTHCPECGDEVPAENATLGFDGIANRSVIQQIGQGSGTDGQGPSFEGVANRSVI